MLSKAFNSFILIYKSEIEMEIKKNKKLQTILFQTFPHPNPKMKLTSNALDVKNHLLFHTCMFNLHLHIKINVIFFEV